ncbi:hypothetical protein [Puia sp.]|uniref:hypothetical protein n=1 Tax=Puia sp. TaxID=2045100 RepID=UPI002F42576F
MRRQQLLYLLFLFGIFLPRLSLAQRAFDDLPIDDPSKRSVLAPGEDPAKKIRDNIFIVTTVDHAECYPGQQVLLSYRLYTALHSTSTVTSKPILNGFTVKERKPDETPLPDKTIDGRHYHGFTVWQALITPLQTGDYTIEPLQAGNTVSYTRADGQAAQYSGVVTSRKTTIHVQPLPAIDRPPAFNGLVGKWKIQSRLTAPRPDSAGNDTLLVDISGAGSFDNIAVPYIRWPAGFRHLEPLQRWDVNDSTIPQTGTKTFAIPFTASVAGQYALPPMELAYFDPAGAKYHSTNTDSLIVHVMDIPAIARPAAPAPTTTAPPVSTGSPIIVKLLFPILLIVVVLVLLILRSRRRRATTITDSAATAPEPATPAATVPAPVTPAATVPEPTVPATTLPAEPPPATPTPADFGQPKLPEEERQLAGIKETLLHFLRSRLNTDAWAEEQLVHLLQQKDPFLAEKVTPLLELCNQLLYAPHRSDPAVLTRLNNGLEEILKQ